MADYRVTCVTRTGNTHEHITHLGGPCWRLRLSDIIVSIDSKTNTFYTVVDGKRADVGVVDGSSGRYVRTYADGLWNNNLLALPACQT